MQAVITILSIDSMYAQYVNPQWVRLLNLLQMNVCYERCSGSELFTADGRRIRSFSRACSPCTWARSHRSIP